MEELLNLLPPSLHGNEFLNGGLILMMVGSLLAYMRKVPFLIWHMLLNRFTTRVVIDSRQDAFAWFQLWLGHQDYGRRARRIMVKVREEYPKSTLVSQEPEHASRSDTRLKVYFTLAPGRHLVRYNGKFFYLYYDQTQPGGDDKGTARLGFMYETIEIRYLGADRSVIREIFSEAERLSFPSNDEENHADLYLRRGDCWFISTRKRVRSPESIICEEGLYETIRGDLKTFLGRKEWYDRMGMPFRRSHLYYGPPGNGKTSTIKSIAGDLGLKLYWLNLAEKSLYEEDFVRLMMRVQPGSLIVMEDVHVIQNKYPRKSSDADDFDSDIRIDFSTFINTIDGIQSPEDVIFIFTTNYYKLLDPVFLRDGRVDREFEFGNATTEMAIRLFHKFHPQSRSGKEFGDIYNNLNSVLCMADLQGILIRAGKDEKLALKILSGYEPKNDRLAS